MWATQANGAAVELPAAAAGRGLGELHVLQEHDGPSSASSASASASEPAAFAWLAGPGLYHGHVALGVEPGVSAPLLDGGVLPFPRSATNPMANPPLSCALTAHHWLMLYADGVLGVNRLMGAVVETVAAPADAGSLKGLVRDGPSGEERASARFDRPRHPALRPEDALGTPRRTQLGASVAEHLYPAAGLCTRDV